MRWRGWLMVVGVMGTAWGVEPAAQPGRVLVADDFQHGLDQWIVEQQPGGTVGTREGALLVDDVGGCTVWLRQRLQAPVMITYDARMNPAGRVSDLNCFWMATDPAQKDGDIAAGPRRDGRFASYDHLRTYYVGYGGNDNTTTRFRRYDGTGARPLDTKNDLRAPEFLLQPGKVYHVTLIVRSDGRVQFIRDGQVVFDMLDATPLLQGWFGFRTVHSRMEIRNFRVSAPAH